MGELNRVVWAALLVSSVTVVGCNDEKKPPLTPDGPDVMSMEAGVDPPPANPIPAPTAPLPPK